MKKQKKIKEKKCFFCQGGIVPDYKRPDILSRFMSERGKIIPRKRTGVCAKHQRALAREIKRARYLALLPFVARV
jgi:small subunit ribosomal protein S18